MDNTMIRTLTAALVLLLAGTGMFPALAQFSGDGSGTEADPYIITNVDQLQEMSNNTGAYYELGNDIDAAETADWNGGEGFEPIDGPFSGTLDGKEYTITYLTINRPDVNAVALFAALDIEGEVSNVGLENIDFIGNGGVAGMAGVNQGIISNSYATGNVKGTTPAIGGLVGNHTSDGTILNSFADVNVEGGQSWVGGLAGLASGQITDSYASGNVTGDGIDVGGLVGDNQGTISNSHATGNVEGGSDRVGGLVGRNHPVATITDSYATGDVNGVGDYIGGFVGRNGGLTTNGSATGNVTGNEEVGGLVGRNDSEITTSYATGDVHTAGNGSGGGLVGNNRGTIENSYATGSITSEGSFSGGLVGNTNDGVIINSYSAGTVEGASFVGGLAGANFDGEITSTYWNTEMNPDLDAVGFGEESGAVGYSNEQMMQQSLYVDWDFNDIWIITEGETYPWLRENPQNPPPTPGEPTNVAIDELPNEFVLEQNYPNPFNPVTQIQFTLPERQDVVLEIFNLLGQRVSTLITNENLSEGLHTITWNATNQNGEAVSSGVYIYRLEAGSFIETKRMIYQK